MQADRPAKQRDFWADKAPCWVLRGCIEAACEACPAFHDRTRPCWEQDTLCKRLLDAQTCFTCQVYLRYADAADRDDDEAEVGPQ